MPTPFSGPKRAGMPAILACDPCLRSVPVLCGVYTASMAVIQLFNGSYSVAALVVNDARLCVGCVPLRVLCMHVWCTATAARRGPCARPRYQTPLPVTTLTPSHSAKPSVGPRMSCTLLHARLFLFFWFLFFSAGCALASTCLVGACVPAILRVLTMDHTIPYHTMPGTRYLYTTSSMLV